MHTVPQDSLAGARNGCADRAAVLIPFNSKAHQTHLREHYPPEVMVSRYVAGCANDTPTSAVCQYIALPIGPFQVKWTPILGQ